MRRADSDMLDYNHWHNSSKNKARRGRPPLPSYFYILQGQHTPNHTVMIYLTHPTFHYKGGINSTKSVLFIIYNYYLHMSCVFIHKDYYLIYFAKKVGVTLHITANISLKSYNFVTTVIFTT